MPPEDRKAQLAAAFDKAAEEEKTEAAPAAKDPVVETPTPETTVDAYKVEAKAAETDPKPAVPTDTGLPTEEQKTVSQDGKATQETSAATATEDPAPISWKAEEKALWNQIPAAARQTIIRRELETQRALSTSAQARKFADEFSRTVSPYAHLIRAQNSTPIQAVDNLMRTAAGLTVGDPTQKARIVAEIIANYGVDIQTLDSVLSSQPAPQNAGQAAIPPQFAQMMQPVYQFMERVEESRKSYEQRMQEAAEKEIEEFGAGKPFFEEVKEDMADLIELAAKRGRTLTLDQAYKQAIAADPKYSSAVEQRNKANEVSQAAATLARARAAASSVSGAPAVGVASRTPKTRREALRQAWDEKAS